MAKAKKKIPTKEKLEFGIRADYQPDDKERDAINRVYTRKIEMENGSDYKRSSKNWDKWRKQWEAHREEKDIDEWQSNHYVPITPAVVESAMAEMIDQTPRPSIIARGSEDKPRAMIMRHVYDYSWERSDGDLFLMDAMQEALVLGTSVTQEYYFSQPRTVRHIKYNSDGEETFEEERLMEYDDCYSEAVKLEDFLVDENARGFDGPHGARDCIRRYVMDIDSFKNFFTGDFWNHLGNAKYVKPGGDTNHYEWYKPPDGIRKDKEVEVLWYWSRLPDDALIVVANDVVVRMGPNIYHHKQLPFARLVDVKRTHRFYGKGEPEILESIQDEKNLLRRMILDRNHLDIEKMWLVDDTAQINEEDTLARPHGIIPGNKDKVSPVEYGDIPRSVEMSNDKLDEDAVIATGIDARFTSLPTKGTATEAALVKEAALRRIRKKLRGMEREFLVRLARLRVANIIQFYSQPKLEKIVGEQDTQQFIREIERLKAKGQIEMVGGVPYKKQYRDIRVENKIIDFDTKGRAVEKPNKGISFFEANPEMFVPVTKGGFDVKFIAGATLPISESLAQTKAAEMYDRLIQLAINGVGYDPVKLGDMLLEVNKFDPEDFKVEEQAQEGADVGDRTKQLLSLAMEENKLLSQGQEIPPTANASPAHTKVHIEFMKSDAAPADPKTMQLFANHVVPEIMAIEQRLGGGQQVDEQGNPVQSPQQGAPTNQLTATQSGEGLRRANTPGKSPKPGNVSDILPGKITGSNNLPISA